MSNLTIKSGMTELQVEAAMLSHKQVECDTIHTFSPGLYTREVRIPAGSLAIGHQQKTQHLNIFLQGRIQMVSDSGEITELQAPMKFVGDPGRKFGYVLEDVVWLNIYPTDETDVEKLEEEYVERSEVWCRLEAPDKTAEIEDFSGVRWEKEPDPIPLPYGSYKLKIGRSTIHGRGVVATARIEAGEILAPSVSGGKVTTVGASVNHSANPNSVEISIGDNTYLKALRGIQGCTGGQDGEEITVDYRKTERLMGEI